MVRVPCRFLVAVITLVTLWSESAWASPITYNIDIGDSTNSIVGTITTDGTIGTLDEFVLGVRQQNILSWDLLIKIGSVSGRDTNSVQQDPGGINGTETGAFASSSQFFLDFRGLGNET